MMTFPVARSLTFCSFGLLLVFSFGSVVLAEENSGNTVFYNENSNKVVASGVVASDKEMSATFDVAALQQRYNDLSRGFLLLLQEKNIPVQEQALIREIMVRAQKKQIRERLGQLQMTLDTHRRQESAELLAGLDRDFGELAELLATLRQPIAEDQALLDRLLAENENDLENGLKNEAEIPDSLNEEMDSSAGNETGEDENRDETTNKSGKKDAASKKDSISTRLKTILDVQKRLNTRVALYESMRSVPGTDLSVIEKGLAELSGVQHQIIELLQSTFTSEGDQP